MASRGYMGPSEVQALIGRWVDLVGGKDHDRNRDRDRDDHDRRHEGRGDYDRDRGWWPQQPPPYQPPSYSPPPFPPQPQYPGPSYQPPYPPYQAQPQPPQAWPASAYRQPLPGPGQVQVRDHRSQPPTFGTKFLHTVMPWSNWIGGEAVVLPEVSPFPPRAAVVDAPLPTQANRDILPMSTGVPVLPTQSAQVTGRPQTLVFRAGRFLISNAGTAGGAADWIVNDIKIGNRSQFVQSGDVPGDLFAVNAIDTFVRFESAQTAMDIVVVVTYIGLNESGCPFFAAMVGTAAV